MQIVAETATTLTLRQRPWPMYLLGVFLWGTSLWAVWTQVLMPPALDGRVVGVILFFVVLGAGFLLLPRTTTVTFDKAAGTVTVWRHSPLRRWQKTYALTGVKQVTVYSGREFDPSAYFVSRTFHLLLWMKKGPHVQLAGGGKLQLHRLNQTAVHIQHFLKT